MHLVIHVLVGWYRLGIILAVVCWWRWLRLLLIVLDITIVHWQALVVLLAFEDHNATAAEDDDRAEGQDERAHQSRHARANVSVVIVLFGESYN